MRKARIENGVVREVLDRDPFPPFAPGLVWVACGAEVIEGYTFDGQAFAAPVPAVIPTTPKKLTFDAIEGLLKLAGVSAAAIQAAKT